MVAEEISEVEWQMWVDQLSREGLSRSRIANHVAVASSIYAWALAPSRRFVTRNPLRMVELPPNDEKPRLRVALVPEAEQLLAALDPEDRVPYAIAFYAGLRRSEIDRLEWPEVLDDGKIASHLLVAALQERGGHAAPPADRRAAAADPRARRGCARAGRPTGPVVERSVMSGKLASARDRRVGRGRPEPDHAARVPPHLRLDADGGRTTRSRSSWSTWATRDLQMVNRYVKLLPQPRDDDAADRLNDYLRRSRTS